MTWHAIEGTVRYLTSAEGGRRTGVMNGYRGQFYYMGEDCDGSQYFPDHADAERVELGETLPVHIRFPIDRWQRHHSNRIYVGMPFEIREGSKTVGRGVVTALEVSTESHT